MTAALVAAGIMQTRTTPVSGKPRGGFCLMGVCFDCLVEIDGWRRLAPACATKAAAGMSVTTENRRIDLAPAYLLDDVPRLREALATRSREDGMVLVGRRQMRNMNSWLHNLPALAKGRNRCTLLISGKDAQRLGIADGGDAVVRSRVGEIVVQCEVTDEMMPGVVSLPHGFGHGAGATRLTVAARRQPGVNANALTDEHALDAPSGTSVANGIPVEVERVGPASP